MQYADCGSLLDWMKAEGRVAVRGRHPARALLLARARPGKAMHAPNLIHRDLKSANLLWCSDSACCVADMGETAWIEDDGTASGTKGTPYFMSPECALGTQYDAKTDIWSLAITVIELAEQKPPRHDDAPDARHVRAGHRRAREADVRGSPTSCRRSSSRMVDAMLALRARASGRRPPSCSSDAYFAGLDAAS
jgi:serine/threonine protein kinase